MTTTYRLYHDMTYLLVFELSICQLTYYSRDIKLNIALNAYHYSVNMKRVRSTNDQSLMLIEYGSQ